MLIFVADIFVFIIAEETSMDLPMSSLALRISMLLTLTRRFNYGCCFVLLVGDQCHPNPLHRALDYFFSNGLCVTFGFTFGEL